MSSNINNLVAQLNNNQLTGNQNIDSVVSRYNHKYVSHLIQKIDNKIL